MPTIVCWGAEVSAEVISWFAEEDKVAEGVRELAEWGDLLTQSAFDNNSCALLPLHASNSRIAAHLIYEKACLKVP
jgi:hypothetical protein